VLLADVSELTQKKVYYICNTAKTLTKNQEHYLLLILTLNLLTTTIVAPPNNTSKWQMGFNSAFKGLIMLLVNNVSLDSSVIIMTRLRAGRSGVRILTRAKILFLLLTCLYRFGADPTSS
jgi:hypothetical protein